MVSGDGTLRIWNRSQLTAPERIDLFKGSVAQIGATNSRHVYALSSDGDLVCWDAYRQEVLSRVARHDGQGFSLAIRPDLKLLATNGIDKKLLLSSLPSLEPFLSQELALVARQFDVPP